VRGLATFCSRDPEPSPYPLPDTERRRLLPVRHARSSYHSAVFSAAGATTTLPRGIFGVKKFMRVHHDRSEVRTNGKGLYEITDDVRATIDRCGVRTGTVTVFVQHTSCSLVVMENADPTARRDLEAFFDRLVPEDADYLTHGSEGSDDMPSHIRMTLTRTSETLPIVDGKMQLGTWQGVFLFEHRRAPHRRKILITIMGEM
jgi:secondary thiamine-phosphate synthase enzyme